MKAKVVTLENKQAGEIDLADDVFGAPVRADLMTRYVNWQRAKAQAGTHKTKTISEISGGGKKPWRQKGTGNARQGSIRSAQWRGGSTIFGPQVRSHSHSLPKKVRKLALKSALSAKQAEGNLHILDDVVLKDSKTKALVSSFAKLGWKNTLIIGGSELDSGFAVAARNVKHVDVLRFEGANVYDILRHRQLVLTKEAVKQLEERLK